MDFNGIFQFCFISLYIYFLVYKVVKFYEIKNISVNVVGFYKPSETETYTEESEGGNHDYFSRLCSNWEGSSELPANLGVRHFIIRSGNCKIFVRYAKIIFNYSYSKKFQLPVLFIKEFILIKVFR